MNRSLMAAALALISVSFATVPAMADVYGVAFTGVPSYVPAATMSPADPAGYNGPYSPGYTLTNVTTSPSSFGGMSWLQHGKQLDLTQAGSFAPDFCSVSFEVPTGSLSRVSPQNPNLTLVVQDTTGDYFYAGKNQGVVPTFIKGQNGYDLFTLTALNSSQGNNFTNATNGAGTYPQARLTNICAVWSGWNETTPAITMMYVTRPLIHSADATGPAKNHVPGTYNGTQQSEFYFQ